VILYGSYIYHFYLSPRGALRACIWDSGSVFSLCLCGGGVVCDQDSLTRDSPFVEIGFGFLVLLLANLVISMK
jgi:hypothetical protein